MFFVNVSIEFFVFVFSVINFCLYVIVLIVCCFVSVFNSYIVYRVRFRAIIFVWFNCIVSIVFVYVIFFSMCWYCVLSIFICFGFMCVLLLLLMMYNSDDVKSILMSFKLLSVLLLWYCWLLSVLWMMYL